MNPLLPLGSQITSLLNQSRQGVALSPATSGVSTEALPFTVHVTGSRPVTADERAVLQQTLEASLKQLSTLIQNNQPNQSTKPLLDQLQLLNNHKLYVSEVTLTKASLDTAQSKLTSQQLVLSATPLPVQQSFTATLNKDGQLIITPTPSDNAKGISAPHSTASISENKVASSTEPLKTITPDAKAAIVDTLKRLLPLKDQAADISPSLLNAQKALQQLPIPERKLLINDNLQKALKTVANHIRSAEQLRQPAILADALKNSGVFFENKLQSTTSGYTPSARSTLDNLVTVLLRQTRSTESPSIDAAFRKTINQDMKGSLLQLTALLDQELKTEPLANLHLAVEQATKSASGKTNPLDAWISFFVKQSTVSQQGASLQQMRVRLLQALHQAASGSIGKIQLQQIQSLLQSMEASPSGTLQQTFHMDIPIRFYNEVIQVPINFYSSWIEDPNEDVREHAEKVRQWTVMLGFELPNAGSFHAQLGLIGKQLSIKLWATHFLTLEKVKKSINLLTAPLENEGITIAQVQCLEGKPIKPDLSINYTLVDIET